MVNRRDFLKFLLTSTAGFYTFGNNALYSRKLPSIIDMLPPFVDSMPILSKASLSINNKYIMEMKEGYHRFHKFLFESRVWGFSGNYLGPTIEVNPNEIATVTWQNNLPKRHIFNIDHRIHGAGADVPDVRTVVHVHGAKTYDMYDGYPEDWFLPGDEILYKYPNEQDAATLWYHDHSIGITRLNIYAGLAGFYLIKDDLRDEKFGFPTGNNDIPLLIQDKQFDNFGQIIYPETFEPEVYGDFNVVNGKIWPYFDVDSIPYRFRLLNASNARFYNLSLEGLPFYQIATEQGILKNFTKLDKILLAPSERAEIVIDFSKLKGENVKMTNDATAPYPEGDPPTGKFKNVMQFRIGRRESKKYFYLNNNEVSDNLEVLINTNATTIRDFTLDMATDEKTGLLMHLLDKKRWDDPDIVKVKLDDVEIWRFINLTEDSHPIHLHLVKFIILERQAFDVDMFSKTGELINTDISKGPEDYERGFKDVVVANPGEVTTIKVKFEGYRGKYVWHCHMLEHEDFEMMLPYEVI